MITYKEYLKSVLKQEALTDYPDVKTAAQKAFDLDKKAIIAATKKKVKASSEKDAARRREMARRLVTRTGLTAQIPGMEDLLMLPTHTTKDLDG
jgi:hypothetical protein